MCNTDLKNRHINLWTTAKDQKTDMNKYENLVYDKVGEEATKHK